MLYRTSNNRITRQPLTFSQKRVVKNLEDTAEKALAQYWDDVERSTLITTTEWVVLASAHFLCTNCNQEALLLQTDCTTRYIKQNLKSCQLLHHYRNKVQNKPIRDRSNEVVRALRLTDVCVCASSHTSTVISVVNKLDRPWTLLTTGSVKSYGILKIWFWCRGLCLQHIYRHRET